MNQVNVDMDIKKNYRPYIGINIRSTQITLSTEFCKRYVKENSFASLHWNESEKTIGIVFFLEDSEVAHRFPLMLHPQANTTINCARFLSSIDQFRMGRYAVTDVDITRTNNVVLKFKLEV